MQAIWQISWFWIDYMKTHTGEEWSRQQNILINSVLKTAREKKLL
jgi:hypothetical protein